MKANKQVSVLGRRVSERPNPRSPSVLSLSPEESNPENLVNPAEIRQTRTDPERNHSAERTLDLRPRQNKLVSSEDLDHFSTSM
jgi:hypothetical protein